MKLKKKSKKVVNFLEGLHNHIVTSPYFRKKTDNKTESQITAELRPLIVSYLTEWFRKEGIKNPGVKAMKSLYWESEEGNYNGQRVQLFGSRQYPDFIIKEPYLVAVEYKQSRYGCMIKHLIGQSIVHTLCGEYDYVYALFHDQNKDKRIEESVKNLKEYSIITKMWVERNVMLKLV
jgi:hypothetical protein